MKKEKKVEMYFCLKCGLEVHPDYGNPPKCPDCDIPTHVKPVLTVKNVKSFMGTEGHGFNATLYVDGVRTAFVIDSAHGGPFDWQILNEKMYKFFSAFVLSHPPILEDGLTLKKDEDWIMSDLVADYELNRDMKRLCKKQTLFLLQGDKIEEGYRTLNIPYNDKAKAYLEKKYGNKVARILNEEVA